MENYVLHIIIRIKTTKRYVQFLGHIRGRDVPIVQFVGTFQVSTSLKILLIFLALKYSEDAKNRDSLCFYDAYI